MPNELLHQIQKSEHFQTTSSDNVLVGTPEQYQRIRQHLSVTQDVPDVFDECCRILDKGENAVLDCINSSDPKDKRAAIYIIVCLAEVNVGEETRRVLTFAQALLRTVECPDENIARLASRAIIYLIHSSKAFSLEMVDIAFSKCGDWFDLSKKVQNTLAGSFLYRDLALFTSTHFFQSARTFFDHVFTALKDNKLAVRVAAAEALHAALTVTSQRETKQKNEWYKRLFEEACTRPEHLYKDDALHSSLLIFNELIRVACALAEQRRLDIASVKPDSAGTIIGRNPILCLTEPVHWTAVESRTANTLVSDNYFGEIVRRCLQSTTSKSRECQVLLLEIFPRLFCLQSANFPLEQVLDWTLLMATKQPQALLSFGLISMELSQPEHPLLLTTKLSKFFSIIANQVQLNVAKKKSIPPMYFKALCLVIRSQKNVVCEDVRRNLPLFLSTGLSPGLTEFFHHVVHNIPSLKTDVLDGLMEQLYLLLMYCSPPSKLAPPTAPRVPSGPVVVQNVAQTKLALETLGIFDFQRHTLQMFMRFIAQGYLVCDFVEIRLAAVKCCVQIVKPFIKVFDAVENAQKLEVYALIRNVLDCLIKASVTDPVVHVRLSVLSCFGQVEKDFLFHLSQKETLLSLFMTLYDEDYQVQEMAVELLSKLTELNPAMIYPKLRRVAKETIYNLSVSRVAKSEVHGARVVCQLSRFAPTFVSSFLNSFLTALIPHLRNNDQATDVTVSVLNAISELALIGGLDLVKATDSLVPFMIYYLKDSTSLLKREAALRALGNLCQSSAYVVEPYKDYPELLELLLKLLKTELSSSMRRLTIRVIGIMGALDPYTHKVFLGTVHSSTSKSLALSLPLNKEKDKYISDESHIIQWIDYERCTLDELYPTLAVSNLVKMLQDNSLVVLYRDIVQAIMSLFSFLGVRSHQYVHQVVPQMIRITESCKPELREFFLMQFAQLAYIIGQQIQPYVDDVFTLIRWKADHGLKGKVIYVLEQVGRALEHNFTPYVGDLCPYLLAVVEDDTSQDKGVTLSAISCVRSLSPCLGGYIHVILPPVLAVLDSKSSPEKVRLFAADTVLVLVRDHDVGERATTIMQTFFRCISVRYLQEKLMSLLCWVLIQTWTQFSVFKDSVAASLNRCKVDSALKADYEDLLHQMENSAGAPPNECVLTSEAANRRLKSTYSNFGSISRIRYDDRRDIVEENVHVNVDYLRRFWTAPVVVSRDEWLQWLSTLRTQLLRQSPSFALRTCAPLAEIHESLAKELFNAAFMSIWTELSEGDQDEVTAQFVDVITICPFSEPIQAILNLAEFMDHSEKGPLPINYDVLSKCAENTRAYAKALRYKELHILSSDLSLLTSDDCQALIGYANKLNLEEAAVGVVKHAEKKQMDISAKWYEKLGEWEQALSMYKEQPEAVDTVVNQMRCLEALGYWSDLNGLSETLLESDEDSLRRIEMEKRQKMFQMASRGWWATGSYERMSKSVAKISENYHEGAFLRAALAIREDRFFDATQYISKVRDMLDSELTAMAFESYERAYGAVLVAQQLTELEEAIEYKLIPERRTRIAILWSRRLQGCRKNIEHWQRILMVRSLVLSQNELRPMWVKFASMCRREGCKGMSRRVLCSLLDLPENSPLETVRVPVDKPFLSLAVCKQVWADGHKTTAYNSVKNLASTLHRLVDRNSGLLPREQLENMTNITAKCYLKLGDWNQELQPVLPRPPLQSRATSRHPYAQRLPSTTTFAQTQTELTNFEQSTKVTLQHYANGTHFNPKWYKAWHKLGTVYYNLVMTERQLMFSMPEMVYGPGEPGIQSEVDYPEVACRPGAAIDLNPPFKPDVKPVVAVSQNPQMVNNYALKAVQCFLKAIQLAEGSRLEDTLRLMMLWFDHGDKSDVYEQLRDSLKAVPVDIWLEVVPQLMSRMDSKSNVGLLVKQVVIDIARAHPQAIVYALTAAKKSKNTQRSRVATEILQLIGEEKPLFIEQACLLNDELIRCAILWHEMWHGTLEEASRLYFQEKNFQLMMDSLRPLHEKIDAGYTTMKEESFNQTYYKELKDAFEHCLTFERTGNQKEITQAWDIYYKVFKKISSQLRQMTALDLSYISPKLLQVRDLELSVPGTYDHGNELVTISSVLPHLEVIMSKQRPRKIAIRGSDGNEYSFLLKGHEDPRQDERIMQLFGLINSLIIRDADTSRRNLSIQRYSIVALSQSSGLIGWVPNCDTLHALIRDYREKHKITISEEHSRMQKMVIDIEKLTLMQKVEVFDEALKSTSGDDLRQTLWMKSPNSEVWFNRRTNYTRSMACMSMVGYILGLGDRHPSNLMLDRVSGKVVHIDFGDCFEVAMKRAKYPEKIPFRLTRMLVRAMEVTGIEGNYRLTCERVLRLLRNNHDSILAVLEAFVYDPVMNWRLNQSSSRNENVFLEQEHEEQRVTGSHTDAISRVKAKLTGRDFNVFEEINVSEQVNRLIEQATLYDNLCQCYIGWCPFW